MKSNSVLVVAVLAVIALALLNPLSSAQAPKEDGESGRYVVAAYSEGTNQPGGIVVCDSKTGQCWKLRSGQNGRWEDQGTPVKAK